jgi:hypothetical protein
MMKLASDYECHPEVLAYDEAPMKKQDEEPEPKKRRRAGQEEADAAEQVAESDTSAGGIRMGNRKLQAIKFFLAGGTDEALRMLIAHVHRVEWSHCCLNDDILSFSWLYVNSTIPPSSLPPSLLLEFQAQSLHAAPVPAPAGLSVQAVSHNTPLSEEEFLLMWVKAMSWFYNRTQHLHQAANRAKHRGGVEDFMKIRLLIQFWCQFMRPTCRDNMSPDEYKCHEKSIICGHWHDLSIIKDAISQFHEGMLSNHAAHLVAETSMQSLQVQDSIMKMRNADLEMFKLLLYSDWGKIRELMTRRNAMIDLLMWLQARHCSQQGKLAKDPCFIRNPRNLNKNNI